MTVQIALCNDEPAELTKTEKLLGVYGQKHPEADFKIMSFESTDKLLGMLKDERYSPHLVFIDIYMSEEKTGESLPVGIEAARRLRDMGSTAKLFFLATSKEHALDAFEVEASRYLLKPLSAEKVFPLLDGFLTELEEEREKYILLRVKGTITRIPLNDIIYCEAKGKSQYIYMKDGTWVRQNLTMARIYEMCSVCQALVKVGVSYIVSLEHIVSMNARELLMDNGQKIYLPRGTFRLLREQYLDYYCGRE